ncbi:hypothetical protein [Amaricoccus sp.]|uniref:hypothetical protein n=1 Tax=Amaricoccus sp. TaxID=1872485 RepID=UPI001B44F16A|nr:hypothetical protein [Amaricoccus sp.]MBP7002857.1 hypothetical protein [Amaricoccus sp.]
MSIYPVVRSAMQDPEPYVGLLHEDFRFVRHQTGTTLDRAEMAALIRGLAASGGVAIHHQRLIYENADVLIDHSLMDFPDGTREAVLHVHLLRDGKILRTETGATPVSR